MNEPDKTKSSGPGAQVWAGRILTALIAAVFIMSGVMKLMGGPELQEGMDKMGMPATMIVPLAILEFVCIIIYLIPETSLLGAILLTGYLGGAICTHWRVGDAFIVPIVIGVLVWLALYLREERLRRLIPVRCSAKTH